MNQAAPVNRMYISHREKTTSWNILFVRPRTDTVYFVKHDQGQGREIYIHYINHKLYLSHNSDIYLKYTVVHTTLFLNFF